MKKKLFVILFIFFSASPLCVHNFAEIVWGHTTQDENDQKPDIEQVVSFFKGKIINKISGEPVSNANVTIIDMQTYKTYEYITGNNGLFISASIPAGNFYVYIFTDGYFPFSKEIINSEGIISNINVELIPTAPIIVKAWADTYNIENRLFGEAVFNVEIVDPDGAEDIQSVKLYHPFLSQALSNGVDMEFVKFVDFKEPDESDKKYIALYQYRTRLVPDIFPRHYSLNVVARDKMGFREYGTIDFNVFHKIQRTIKPSEILLKKIENNIARQTLVISVSVEDSPAQRVFAENNTGVNSILEKQNICSINIAGLSGLSDECYVEVKIYRPDATLYNTYKVYDSMDITIPDAEEGEWRYETINHCADSVDIEIETRGSNTGILTGKIQNLSSGQGISDAAVSWNNSADACTFEDGYFSMITVAGTGVLTTSALEYKTNLRTDIAVMSGETKTITIKLIPANSSALPVPHGISVDYITNPLSLPDPEVQPFAASIVSENLIISALFPAYKTPVYIYLGLSCDHPDLLTWFFLFNTENQIVSLEDSLLPWRKETKSWQQEESLVSVPVEALPKGNYTFYSLVTDDPVELKTYDLKYFTINVE